MAEERPLASDSGRLAGLDRPLRNRVTPAGELIATSASATKPVVIIVAAPLSAIIA